jgi:hypothetical protein
MLGVGSGKGVGIGDGLSVIGGNVGLEYVSVEDGLSVTGGNVGLEYVSVEEKARASFVEIIIGNGVCLFCFTESTLESQAPIVMQIKRKNNIKIFFVLSHSLLGNVGFDVVAPHFLQVYFGLVCNYVVAKHAICIRFVTQLLTSFLSFSTPPDSCTPGCCVTAFCCKRPRCSRTGLVPHHQL